MKKSQNIKVRPVYKAFALATLLGIAGACTKYEHKNVVVDAKPMDYDMALLLRDVNDGTERYYIDAHPYHMYLVGDTISVRISGLLSDDYYTRNRVLKHEGGDCRLVFNKDSIWARQNRSEVYKLKNQITKSR